MSNFRDKVIHAVSKIPHGKVASYGQIALMAESPRSARQVGQILRSCEEKIPWWRIVNNSGRVSIKGNPEVTAQQQKELLELEGIHFDKGFDFDIDKYRFRSN